MQLQFNSELGQIKSKYNSAVELVTNASTNLGELFKDKMVKIKARISKQFA